MEGSRRAALMVRNFCILSSILGWWKPLKKTNLTGFGLTGFLYQGFLDLFRIFFTFKTFFLLNSRQDSYCMSVRCLRLNLVNQQGDLQLKIFSKKERNKNFFSFLGRRGRFVPTLTCAGYPPRHSRLLHLATQPFFLPILWIVIIKITVRIRNQHIKKSHSGSDFWKTYIRDHNPQYGYKILRYSSEFLSFL